MWYCLHLPLPSLIHYLMVSLKRAHKAHKLGANSFVHHLVDVRERIRVKEACFVQLSVIHKHPLGQWFGDEDHGSDLFRVDDRSDVSDCCKRLDLLSHELSSV